MARIYRVEDGFDHTFFKDTSCAFGVFDGVHQGHRYLLNCARETARVSGGVSLALTFDIDPDEVFHARRLKKLITNDKRLQLLAQTGVDAVVVLPFTKAFAALTPEAFLDKTFNGTTPAFLHVGDDFKFGVHASGTVHELDAWAESSGTTIVSHALQSVDGAPISATRIRILLAQGNIEEANKLLGYPYFISGRVEVGRGEGAALGFRTANLCLPAQLLALGDGVYAAWAKVGQRRYKAAVNMGVAATFADQASATCEVHLLDFAEDLYGQTITVEFAYWLRAMRKFDDLDELITTVKDNITWVRTHL